VNANLHDLASGGAEVEPLQIAALATNEIVDVDGRVEGDG